ncbi:MAG: hypothetical protein NT154_08540 [Verrucomicrobia bacterium]|nr:hypothetical protein [Verrucomicrobiota bacterium]
MNAAAIRTAGRYLGALGAIVCVVVLLSLLFTFLGTITCAVLAGMMMGAFKGAKWFSVAVSLVFPGVVFGMVRGARVELTPHQVILLAVVCFVTFWVTYLVSAFVLFCEQKERKVSRPAAPATQLNASAPGGLVAVTGSSPVAGQLESAKPRGESCLEQLQGSWVCELSNPGETMGKKIIHINEAKLELKLIDTSGRITLLARGDVMLESPRQA